MMNPLTNSNPYIRGGAAGLAAGSGSGLLEILGHAIGGPLDMLNEPRRAMFRMMGAPSGTGAELLFGARPTRSQPFDPRSSIADYESMQGTPGAEMIPPPAEEMPYPVWQEALGSLADLALDPVNLLTSGAGFLARSIPQSARLAKEASALSRMEKTIAPRSAHIPNMPGATDLGIAEGSPLLRALRSEPMGPAPMPIPQRPPASPSQFMTPDYLRQQLAINPDKMINYEVSPLQQSLASLLENAPIEFRRSPGVHGYAGPFNPWQ